MATTCCHPTGVCVDDGCLVCQQPKKRISEAELAYAAGILDGEGSIEIVKRGGTVAQRYPINYALVVAVQTTDRVIAPWLHQKFGGALRRKYPKNYAIHGWKYPYQWSVQTKAAEEFLRMIRPYLRLKEDQADVAIRFRETVIGHGVAIGDIVRKQRTALWQELRDLRSRE